MKATISALSFVLKGKEHAYPEFPRHALLVGDHGTGKTTHETGMALALSDTAPELALSSDTRDPGRLIDLLPNRAPGRAEASATIQREGSSTVCTWSLELTAGAKMGVTHSTGPRYPLAQLFPVRYVMEALGRSGPNARNALLQLALSESREEPAWLGDEIALAEAEGAPDMSALAPVDAVLALMKRSKRAEKGEEPEEEEPSAAVPTLLELVDSLDASAMNPELLALVEAADSTEVPEGEQRPAITLSGLFAKMQQDAHQAGRAEGAAAADQAAMVALTTGAGVEGLAPQVRAGVTRLRAEIWAAGQAQQWAFWLIAAVCAVRAGQTAATMEQVIKQIEEGVGDPRLKAELITRARQLGGLPLDSGLALQPPGHKAERDHAELWAAHVELDDRYRALEAEIATLRAAAAASAWTAQKELGWEIRLEAAQAALKTEQDTSMALLAEQHAQMAALKEELLAATAELGCARQSNFLLQRQIDSVLEILTPKAAPDTQKEG